MERTQVSFFDLYAKYVAGTEAPFIFHRWSMITAIGAMLGRQVWFPFGSARLAPNHFTMLVGDPGTRKSSAIKLAAKLIEDAGYDSFGAQRTSKEKFLMDLAGEEDLPEVQAPKRKGASAIDVLANLNLRPADDSGESLVPREMFVAADEFRNFIGTGNVDFHSLLGELWDWDSPKRTFKQRLKNSKSIEIYQPTVSMLGGTTPSQFAEIFPLASIGQGFMSRLILVHSEASGIKVTFPPAPPEELTLKLVGFLQQMRITCQGPLELEEDAMSALDTIYKGWADLPDARFKHYSTRRFTHLLKLLIIVVCCRLSMRATLKDVIHANTLLAFAETTMPKAIGELGKSRHAEAANKVMQVLYSARDAKSIQDLWKVVQNDLEKIGDLGVLLQNLQTADKIQAVQTANGRQGYLAKVVGMSRSVPYTNYDLLKGLEIK